MWMKGVSVRDSCGKCGRFAETCGCDQADDDSRRPGYSVNGVDAPFEQTLVNVRYAGNQIKLHKPRPRRREFPWKRGELDGIQSGDWKKGKRP